MENDLENYKYNYIIITITKNYKREGKYTIHEEPIQYRLE
jgi:hypothetical protein